MTDDEYWRQGVERLGENIKAVQAIVETFPEPRRSRVRLMLEGPVGEQFYQAPASSRRGFHYAFPGGLVMHSLGVVKYTRILAQTLAPDRWPAHKLMFVALFHDLGKAGPREMPNYIPTREDWKRKRGEYYDIDKRNWMPTSEKGLYILQEEGIQVDFEEYMAIRLNDGAGPPENKPYSFKEPDLALVVHWADHWQSRLEKAEESEEP